MSRKGSGPSIPVIRHSDVRGAFRRGVKGKPTTIEATRSRYLAGQAKREERAQSIASAPVITQRSEITPERENSIPYELRTAIPEAVYKQNPNRGSSSKVPSRVETEAPSGRREGENEFSYKRRMLAEEFERKRNANIAESVRKRKEFLANR